MGVGGRRRDRVSINFKGPDRPKQADSAGQHLPPSQGPNPFIINNWPQDNKNFLTTAMSDIRIPFILLLHKNDDDYKYLGYINQ